MHGRHSREKQWGVGAFFSGFRRFLSSPRRATLAATALIVPVLVAGGLALLPASSRRPAPSGVSTSGPPSTAAHVPQATATPELTLRARTEMAEPVRRVRRPKATSGPATSPRPVVSPSNPFVCFRWWYGFLCRRRDDLNHHRGGYGPYRDRYGSWPRR